MAADREVPAPERGNSAVLRGGLDGAEGEQPGEAIRFAHFELDQTRGELRGNGHLLKIQDQPLRLLCLLASRPGQLVRREEIRNAIWGPDTFVDFEQGINYSIRQLRRALDDEADAPRYIETLPRKGYRFIARVEGSSGAPARGTSTGDGVAPARQHLPMARRGAALRRSGARAAGAMALAAGILALVMVARPDEGSARAPADRPMLAVLPFANMTGDAGNDYLADGLTEELITQLGRSYSRRLGVIARTSVIAFAVDPPPAAEIGRRLGADYLLEGSLRSSAERLRVTAQLIRASDQSHLWATSYDRPLTDLIEVQSEVSRRISEALALQILPPADRDVLRASAHPEAYELWLKARHLLNRNGPGDPREALDDLERAVAIDPGFSRGWSLLAEAWRALRLPTERTTPQAREAALKALSLDDTNEDAWLLLALVRFYYDLDPEGARQAFERAIRSHPDLAIAHHQFAAYWSVTGRHDMAIASVRRALALDPLSPEVNVDVGWFYYYARRYDEAIEASRRTLELIPGYSWAHRSLILSLLLKGDLRGAVEAGRAEMIERKADARVVARMDPGRADSAMSAYRMWDLERWERDSRRLKVQPIVVGLIYASLGYEEAAIFTLERACESKADWMTPFLRVDPLADPLRDHPRFQALMERLDAGASGRASL